MTVDLSALPLDWDLALKRLRRDMRDDFFPDPLQYRDLFAAPHRAQELLRLDNYSCDSTESWDAPKSNFTLRHCINVTALDRLVYQALVDYLCADCDRQFTERSYAFRLRSATAEEMFLSFVKQKGAFDAAVRSRIDGSHQRLVVALDVAQYFENIDLRLLRDSLVSLTQAKLGQSVFTVVDVLVQCLTAWSPYQSVGLPQNMFPSSFLGNAFMHGIDLEMIDEGWDYYRYMDDVRVVVESETAARTALRSLITKLRARGLSVNGKKTDILRAGGPGWDALLRPPDDELAAIETLVNSEDLAVLPGCVERLNQMLTELVAGGCGERGRLRFCLGRLTSLRRLRAKLDVPTPPHCGTALLRAVVLLPEETTYICDYLASGLDESDVADTLADIIENEPLCIYGWQNYRLWLLATKIAPRRQSLIDHARRVVADSREGAEVAGAALYLGEAEDDESLSTLLKMLAAGRFTTSVKRALMIATQTIRRGSPGVDVEGSSPTLAMLSNFLDRLPSPVFVGRPRRSKLKGLADEMPDNFS